MRSAQFDWSNLPDSNGYDRQVVSPQLWEYPGRNIFDELLEEAASYDEASANAQEQQPVQGTCINGTPDLVGGSHMLPDLTFINPLDTRGFSLALQPTSLENGFLEMHDLSSEPVRFVENSLGFARNAPFLPADKEQSHNALFVVPSEASYACPKPSMIAVRNDQQVDGGTFTRQLLGSTVDYAKANTVGPTGLSLFLQTQDTISTFHQQPSTPAAYQQRPAEPYGNPEMPAPFIERPGSNPRSSKSPKDKDFPHLNLPDTYAGRRTAAGRANFPRECGVCHQRFLYKDSIEKHFRKHHEGPLQMIVHYDCPTRPPPGKPRNRKAEEAQTKRASGSRSRSATLAIATPSGEVLSFEQNANTNTPQQGYDVSADDMIAWVVRDEDGKPISISIAGQAAVEGPCGYSAVHNPTMSLTQAGAPTSHFETNFPQTSTFESSPQTIAADFGSVLDPALFDDQPFSTVSSAAAHTQTPRTPSGTSQTGFSSMPVDQLSSPAWNMSTPSSFSTSTLPTPHTARLATPTLRSTPQPPSFSPSTPSSTPTTSQEAISSLRSQPQHYVQRRVRFSSPPASPPPSSPLAYRSTKDIRRPMGTLDTNIAAAGHTDFRGSKRKAEESELKPVKRIKTQPSHQAREEYQENTQPGLDGLAGIGGDNDTLPALPPPGTYDINDTSLTWVAQFGRWYKRVETGWVRWDEKEKEWSGGF